MDKRPILITAALLVLLCAGGALFYRHAANTAADLNAAAPARSRSFPAEVSCVDFPRNRTSGTDLHAMQTQARRWVDAARFDQALAQYREIAAADPGFPAVNLDISRMLLKLKQPRLAKEAINTQIAVSECLPHLQLDRMDEYCKAENFPTTLDCMKELNSGQESAYVQAALVQMELGRALSPTLDANAASKPAAMPVMRPVHDTLAPPRPSPATALARSNAPAASNAPFKLKPIKRPNSNQLAAGTGTDAALGAYSK